MNTEQAFRIAVTVQQMKNLADQLTAALDEVGASGNQRLMAHNVSQGLATLEGSLRPITPTSEDIARHPSNPRR